MLFTRLYNDQLAQAGYLIACQATKEAIVVDPARDPAPWLEAARRENVRIVMVTETHVHADFVSGASALAAAAGAELLLSGEGEGDAVYRRDAYPGARWLHDGDVLRIGRVRLDVLHLPGHTPEHLGFLVTDEATSNQPIGLVSGDFLFVGDVGRPDLLERAVGAVGTMENSARRLHASLQRVRALPEFLQVWPGHGAGSACGKALGAVPQSTLGYELRANWAFAAPDLGSFVAEVLAGQPEPPPYFARMKQLNASGGPPIVERAPVGDDLLAGDVVVVDARPPADFARGHLPGALNIPLGKSFLGWAGSVLDPARDVVLLAPRAAMDAAKLAQASLRLIGIDRVRGVVASEDALAGGTGPLATLGSIPAASLGASAAPGVTVLDVRNGSEWAQGHVPGAVHIPLPELTRRLDELRDAGPIQVHCQGGSRSAVAASVLRAAGHEDVVNVEGGYAAWIAANGVRGEG